MTLNKQDRIQLARFGKVQIIKGMNDLKLSISDHREYWNCDFDTLLKNMEIHSRAACEMIFKYLEDLKDTQQSSFRKD